MNNFTFYTPTKYLFGRGVETKAGELARQFLGQKIMIVYGHGSVVRSGLLSRVTASLAEAGVSWTELGGVDPNPTDTLVYKGIEEGRKENIDGVLAVGGGSAIDTAKAIALGIPYNGDFWDFYAGRLVPEKALRSEERRVGKEC